MAYEAGGMAATFGVPVPDVFADEAVVFDMANGTLRITFAVISSVEPAAPSEAAMASIGRLIMPIQSAQRLCLGLYDYLKSRGLDPQTLISEGATAQ